MNHLAIVPARGGSKRLRKKNLMLLDGKPLVQHTLEAVAHTNRFKTILLSSDDDEILEVAKNVPGVTADKRDPNLAQDKTKVRDLIIQIANREGYEDLYDTIGLFLPTCPFRQTSDIVKGLDLITKEDDSVVSISRMQDPVQLSMSIDEDTRVINPEVLMNPSPLKTGQTRSQDFETYYKANGGFYISWIEKFKQNKNYFLGRVKGVVIDDIKNVDIDTELDFKWAEFLINNGYFSFENK